MDQSRGVARAIAEQGKKISAEVEELTAQKETFERAAAVLASIGEERQQQAQAQVEGLVTRGLQAVFGEELSFHIEQTMSGARPEVNFLVRSTLADGKVIETDVLSSRGGGLASVVGAMLRVVIMILEGNKSPIAFDETFGMLSAEYEGRLAEFLKLLAEEADIQIILVTHSDAYNDFADRRYRFELNKAGTTVVKEI